MAGLKFPRKNLAPADRLLGQYRHPVGHDSGSHSDGLGARLLAERDRSRLKFPRKIQSPYLSFVIAKPTTLAGRSDPVTNCQWKTSKYKK